MPIKIRNPHIKRTDSPEEAEKKIHKAKTGNPLYLNLNKAGEDYYDRMIPGTEKGDNLSILNVIEHKPQKVYTDDGQETWTGTSLDLVYYDVDTGEKLMKHLPRPRYVYYLRNNYNSEEDKQYSPMFVRKQDTIPIVCHYDLLLKSIAHITDHNDYYDSNFYDKAALKKLINLPEIFNADMNLADHYRYRFNKFYRNQQIPVTKLFLDIETDGIDLNGAFPEHGDCPVNAITLIDPAGKNSYTLLLQNYKYAGMEEFEDNKELMEAELKEQVIEHVGGIERARKFGLDDMQFQFIFYDSEISLIADCFRIINILKRDFVLAWNMAFDIPFLLDRIRVLGYSPENIVCHEDFSVKEAYYYIDKEHAKFEERGDYAHISSYSVYVDQLITFASIRKGQRAYSSMKLDTIGSKVAGIGKLDYSHITRSIVELPYKDYKTFAFYNVLDVICQVCIEAIVNDVDYIYGSAMMSNTRYSKVHRQTVYLVNRGIQDFWDMGYVIGNNHNKANKKEGYPGAYVADPILLSDKARKIISLYPSYICDNADDFDYTALYPSIIAENNMAPNTQIGKVIFLEQIDPHENRFNNDYFDRSVWFIEDLNSHNWLDFCHRYLNLGTYEEVFWDVLEYFNTVANSGRDPRPTDIRTGYVNVCRMVPQRNVEVCRMVDENEPIQVCYSWGGRPEWNIQ